MHSTLLRPQNVIVQGITGTQGSFHAATMRATGTNIVAGTSPNKAGSLVDGIPVYASIQDITQNHQVDASVIFVPAPHAKGAMLEAIREKIPLIICITEDVPIHDMLEVKQRAAHAGVVVIGPNCPGILVPGITKLGIIPAAITLPGNTAVVSRSGTLTYEAVAGLSQRSIGQKYIIGIGGDRIRGTGFIECLELFQQDPEVRSIVLIGEIGGTDEQAAARYIKSHVTKAVYAYIAGHSAPVGIQLGHAGAILGNDGESAAHKTRALKDAGAYTYTSVTELVRAVK